MKSTTRRYTLLGLGLAVVFVSMTAIDAQELTWAEKMFEKLSHDFGVVARGSDVSYRFKITNIYKPTLRIASVRTTCGCSAAKPSKNTLASLEVAYVDVTMDTRLFIRRKDSHLIVTFEKPHEAEVQIPVTVYIRTDVVLDPGSVNFGAVDQKVGGQRKIGVAYAGRDDWKIKEIRNNNKHLDAMVVETDRGGGNVHYDLLVTLKPSVPVGEFRELLLLITDDPNSPQVPVLVEARVETDVTVTPDVVSLGVLVIGRPKTVNVVVQGKIPFTIDNVECGSDSGDFKVQLPTKARLVHVLPLTITPPNKLGTFRDEFSVTITGRAEPVKFKVYGKVSDHAP